MHTHTHHHARNTQLEELPPESWFSIFLGSFNDATLIVLIISAIVSLAIGIYEVGGWGAFGYDDDGRQQQQQRRIIVSHHP